MGTGTAVNTGDLITAAKQNLKLEDARDLAALGILDQSGVGAQELLIACSENLTADRTLTITLNDADRTIDLGGAITTGGAFTTSGAFGLTLTISALTNVTLPTTGTLATLAGAENLTNKTLTASVLSGTFTGTPTFSGATITLTGGTLNLTGGAAYVVGTTDGFILNLKTNNVNKLGITTTLGQFTVYQTTANITLAVSDPAAARTITFADPLGNDSVAYLAAAQTLTNKTINGATLSGTLAGNPTLSGTVVFSGAINLTSGADFVIGTTDNFAVTIKANNANRFTISATLGDLVVPMTGGDVTFRVANPGAARVITVADPGGAATLAYINQAQTISAAHTFSGNPVFSRAGNTGTFTNSNDAASSQVAIFEGDRATPGDNDEAYLSLRLSDGGGTQREGARITWAGTTIAAGATGDTDLILSALVNNTLTQMFVLDGSAGTVTLAVTMTPVSNDGAALGTTLLGWSDLFLATGGVINWNNGEVTITETDANTLTLAGATLIDITAGIFELNDAVRFDTGVAIVAASYSVGRDADGTNQLHFNAPTGATMEWSINDAAEMILSATNLTPGANDGNALGSATVSWADLFLASEGVINWNNGNMTLTHGAGTVVLSGGTMDIRGNLLMNAAGYDLVIPGTTATAWELTNGVTALMSLDTRTSVDNVVGVTWTALAPTIASANGTTWRHHSMAAVTVTLTGGTGVTAMDGIQLYINAPTVTSGSATTVTTASTFYVAAAPTAGGSVTITNRYIINTGVAGCFLTAAGTWTDASTREAKTDIHELGAADWDHVLEDIQHEKSFTFRKADPSEAAYERYGVIAEEVSDHLAMPSRNGVSGMYVAGMALAGVKALLAKVDRLEAELAAMRA